MRGRISCPMAVTWGGIVSGILAAPALDSFDPWWSSTGAAVARARAATASSFSCPGSAARVLPAWLRKTRRAWFFGRRSSSRPQSAHGFRLPSIPFLLRARDVRRVSGSTVGAPSAVRPIEATAKLPLGAFPLPCSVGWLSYGRQTVGLILRQKLPTGLCLAFRASQSKPRFCPLGWGCGTDN